MWSAEGLLFLGLVAVVGYTVHPLVSLLVLVVRWVLSFRAMRTSARHVRLITIPPSHFVERARWALDYCGVDYVEETHISVLGVFLLGRTVPELRVAGSTRISGSSAIVRAVGAWYGRDKRAFFHPDNVEMERDWVKKIDRYGIDLQQMIYAYGFDDSIRTICVAWGYGEDYVPMWQKVLGLLFLPLILVFMFTVFRTWPWQRKATQERAKKRAEVFLASVEEYLSERKRLSQPLTLMGGENITHVDIQFAALSLWNESPEFPRAALYRQFLPIAPQTSAVCRELRERYPVTSSFVSGLYRDHRQTPAKKQQ